MTLPIVNTPITGAVPAVSPREARWNPALLPALAGPPAPELLERLNRPDALVVTTGQQPGLFTGPSYAITKALSARGLALTLEQKWKRPVIPVYWIPGDDHDLREAGNVSWIGTDGGLRSASLPARPADAPLIPMSHERLGPSIKEALDRFAESFAGTPERETTVRWLRRHYTPDATVAGAYGAALAELLGPLGIVCLDSTHPAVKREAAGLLLRALETSDELVALLAEEEKSLQARGIHPGVPVDPGVTMVFLEGRMGRDRLVRSAKSDTFELRRTHEQFRLDDLRSIADAEPTRLSANVLLRPVLESALLPTVAYVAGPAELRYLELTAPLYQALQVPRQQPVPRWSGFLIEPRVTRTLEKHRITVEELMIEGRLENRIARGAFPDGTEAALRALKQSIEERYPAVVRAAGQIDPTLEASADGARRRALFAIDKLEKKLVRHARKRESTEIGQIALARTSVCPHGKPQERVISLSGFLARYGPIVLEELATHIAHWYG